MTEITETVKDVAARAAPQARRVRQSIKRQAEVQERTYAPQEERPLRSYTALLGVYGITSAGLAGLMWRKRRHLPDRLSVADVAMLAVATFKLSRVVSRESVTSPLRAPFSRYDGAGGVPSEVNEQVRGSGIRKVLGELVTCPFCLAQWFATALVAGQVMAPRATRVAAGALTVAAVSDGLQLAYAQAAKAAA